ncbi:MAG: hypothetical protein JSW55_15445 [Chloroflexota bacterium]|nr:MAG: hypothetical protein JSW55_15445 [Chloroflexota bacterium]
MVELKDLKNRNPRAWTLLLTQNTETTDIIVAAVGEEPLPATKDVSRFLLSLAGYHEPFSLIGKRTNPVEALFYEAFAPQFPHFTPTCWFSHVGVEDGWLVLTDVQNDHPPEHWTGNDVDILIGNLASLHAAFWGKREVLAQYGLPDFLGEAEAEAASIPGEGGDEQRSEQLPDQMARIERWLQGQRRHLTEHAKRTAGPLTPLLAEASDGLYVLRQVDGWPGIVDEQHLAALADLLDDPLPMLYPLRQLPSTLLHGDPSAKRWCLTLFDDYYLLDWQKTAIGPGVYDLLTFIDQMELLADERRSRVNEETMIDSYILAMRGELGTRFDARATRQAIPAARCLHVLGRWLPFLGESLQQLRHDDNTWPTMEDLSDEELIEAGLTQLPKLRTSLATVFDRFLRDYRSL